MFSLESCSKDGCTKAALTYFNEAGEMAEGPFFCVEHCPWLSDYQKTVAKYIETHDKIVGLSAAGLSFSDMDFSGKKFYGCNFQHCTFSNIQSENFRARISSFDFAIFTDCNLLKSNFRFTSLAGAVLSHTLFTNSDLIHNNFNGINAIQSAFDDSDLYNSRFIRAELNNTSFRNCNIKKTCFYEIKQENVSFKLSNTREALFSVDEVVEE